MPVKALIETLIAKIPPLIFKHKAMGYAGAVRIEDGMDLCMGHIIMIIGFAGGMPAICIAPYHDSKPCGTYEAGSQYPVSHRIP